MKTVSEIKANMAQCHGTSAYHKLTMCSNLVATDGVAQLAQDADCFWLMDVIASYQGRCAGDDMLRDMQFWKLAVSDGSAVVTCDRDEGDEAFRQEIDYTDFPLDELKIWVEAGSCGGKSVMVAMLPQER